MEEKRVWVASVDVGPAFEPDHEVRAVFSAESAAEAFVMTHAAEWEDWPAGWRVGSFVVDGGPNE